MSREEIGDTYENDSVVIDLESEESKQEKRNSHFNEDTKDETKSRVYFDPASFHDEINSILRKSENAKLKIAGDLDFETSNEADTLLRDAFARIEDIKKAKATGFAALPVIGTFIRTAKSKLEEEQRKQQSIQEVIENTFKSLDNKKDKAVNTAIQFMNIKKEIKDSIAELTERCIFLESIIADDSTDEGTRFNVRRLLTMIAANMAVLEENVANINAAQNMCQDIVIKIEQMLPTIKNTLVDGLAINAFLDKLTTFKDSFTSISKLTNSIQEINAENINSMILKNANWDEMFQEQIQGTASRTQNRKKLALELSKAEQKNFKNELLLQHTITENLKNIEDVNSTSNIFRDMEEVQEGEERKIYVPDFKSDNLLTKK